MANNGFDSFTFSTIMIIGLLVSLLLNLRIYDKLLDMVYDIKAISKISLVYNYTDEYYDDINKIDNWNFDITKSLIMDPTTTNNKLAISSFIKSVNKLGISDAVLLNNEYVFLTKYNDDIRHAIKRYIGHRKITINGSEQDLFSLYIYRCVYTLSDGLYLDIAPILSDIIGATESNYYVFPVMDTNSNVSKLRIISRKNLEESKIDYKE